MIHLPIMRAPESVARPTDGIPGVAIVTVDNASMPPLPGMVSVDPDHKRVTRKHLLPEAFSHVEDREECLALEYTPYCVESPVDMRYPSRVARMHRRVQLVFGVVVPAGASRDCLERSLQSVSANIRVLLLDGWQWTSIAVVIIVDGMACLSASMLDYLQAALRLFDASMTVAAVGQERVHMHVFERTLELPKHAQAREYFDPMQVTLGVTNQQAGDMRSYQWLLNAFCQQMQPEYVITVAAGCKLQPKCARQLLHRFERQASAVLVLPDAHIASPMLFNPVTMSQLFMSKYCAALTVPFSSAFGYVSHTSPTCAVVGLSHCAALRWKALPVSALGKFFEGQERAIVTLGPMAANRLMTPLDVLSWELHRSGPLVGTRAVVFESSATAHADFPASFLEFFDQQRIAFNGQMFNALHYLAEAPKVLLFGNAFVDEGGPSASLLRCVKRCALAPLHFIQYLHVFITLFANWFALAASYLMLHILTGTTLEESKFQPANGVKYAFKFIFVLLVLGQAVSALGVELSDMKLLYTIIACVYSIMFALLIIMAVWMASYHHVHAWLLYAAAASAVLTLVAFSVHGKLYSALKSALQFTLTSPVYFLMVPIHALATCNNVAVHQRIRHVAAPSQQDPLDAIRSPTFANGRFPVDAYPGPGAIIESPWDPQEVHNLLDVGTRPHTDQADMHRLTIARRQFAAFRTRTLMLYLGTNWLAVSFFLSFNFITYFPWALVGYGLIVTAARFVGSMVALLSHWLHSAFRLIDRVCCCCVHTHAMPSHPASGSVQPAAAGKASAPHHHSEKQPSGRSSFSAERASVVGSEAGQRSVPSQSRSPSAHKEFSRHSATSERRSVTPQRVEEARDSFVAPSPQYTLEHVVHLNREYLDAEAAVDAVVASSRAAVAAVVENAKQHSSRQLFGTGDSSRHVRQDRSIAQLPTADRRRSRSPSDSGSVGSGRHSNSPLMVPDDEPSHPHSLMQLAARGGSSRGSVASQGTASQASIVSMGGIRASGSVNSLRRLVAPAAAADGVSSHLHEHHADLTAVKPARRASSPTRVQAHTPGRTAADAILPRQSAPQSPIVPARAYTAGIPALEEPTIRLSPSSSFRTPVTSHKHSALVEPSLHTPSDIPIRFGGDGGSVSSRASSRATDLRMVSDTAEVDAALQHAAAMAMDLGMDPIQPLGQFLQISQSYKRGVDEAPSEARAAAPVTRARKDSAGSKPPIQPRVTPQASARHPGFFSSHA